MKRTTALVTTLFLCALVPAFADYSVSERGEWPKNWPKALEPLRKQARTLVGPMVEQRHYAIPFTRQKAFEAAWPHLLKVKSKGAPIFLINGPDFFLGDKVKAGVIVHCPPLDPSGKDAPPPTPIPGVTEPRVRWMNANYLEVVVDDAVINWKHITLPKGVQVIDERDLNKEKQP